MARIRVFVAGHTGMVGSALVRLLQRQNHIDLVLRTRAELDLVDQQAVVSFFSQEKIDCVYMAAAKVGGISANNAYPADFIYQNLMIQCNVIHAAHLAGIQQLLFLGSSCIYPKLAAQPMIESELLTGKLEPTNEPYAMAKIAGIKLCESYNRQYGRDYRSVMPTNLYGINDNFHPENAHVIPALIQRFHLAKINQVSDVIVWGTGSAMREFLCVDDLAAACVFVMNLKHNKYLENTTPMLSHINIGTGEDCTISSLADIVAKVIGYKGRIIFDSSKPEGTPRKLLNVSTLKALGWKSSISLEQGLHDTYQWFLKQDAKNISTR